MAKQQTSTRNVRTFNWHIASQKSYGRGYRRPTEKIMEPTDTLRFTLTYPLANHFHFSETHPDGSGWTEQQFCEAVHRAYVHVYTAEGPDPGCVSGLFNRAESHGPYGISCHHISDSSLAEAHPQDDGSWYLVVLS